MEHKAAPLRLKKVKPVEPAHTCGTCQHYTEEHFVDGELVWEEFCYAGCTYREMRHTVNCPKWDERRADYYA